MDFQTIIIVVAVVLLLAYLFNRLQSRNNQMGSERPRYNDPNVQGQGSFGNNESNRNQNVSNYQRRDDDRFDNAPGQSQSTSGNQSSRRRDEPNVQGQGSFGRDKD